MFVIDLLSYGFGPLFIGGLSDLPFVAQVSGLGAEKLIRVMCEGSAQLLLTPAQDAACAIANPQSLQLSLLSTASLYAVGGGLLFLTCRWIKEDPVPKQERLTRLLAPAEAGISFAHCIPHRIPGTLPTGPRRERTTCGRQTWEAWETSAA